MGGCNMIWNMNKCFRKRNINECKSWHYCWGWMQIMWINTSQQCTWQIFKKSKKSVWCLSHDLLLSQLPCGHSDKTASMTWIFVAYALCTTLANHPDTQSIVQTTHLCLKHEAKVKVMAPWQMIYWIEGKTKQTKKQNKTKTVSYTHLTLPTMAVV